MLGWSQREIQIACAVVILVVLVVGGIFAILDRFVKDKQGPWTL